MTLPLVALATATTLLAQAEPRFEVLVLGTHHAPAMFRSDRYTPAHIRATLALAKPDVVAVESHPVWFAHGRYHVVTYEAEGVAVPFARERDLPVFGVDWKDIDAWDRGEEMQTLRASTGLVRSADSRGLSPWDFGSLPLAAARAALADARAIDWQHINSAEYGESRYRGQSPDDDDFAAERDRRIAANCIDVMRAYPDKRLVVVIGAHHKPYLEILLGRHPGIRVLHSGVDVPYPSDAEVDDAWKTTDLLATLGHELDSGPCYFHPELVRASVAKSLDRLEQLGEAPDAARYFRARWASAQGDAATAARLFDDLIAKHPVDDVYPFPMHEWRQRYTLDEAARIERARLVLEEGDENGARALLAPVQRALAIRLRDLERTRPRETRRFDAIADPGFELGRRAADIFDGWSSYVPTGHGKLRFGGDERQLVEGERSLRLDIVAANPLGYGFLVRQEIELPVTAVPDRPTTWSVQVRVHGLERASIEIMPPWSSREREPLAVRAIDVADGDWQHIELPFTVPADGHYAIHFRFDGPAGSSLWLDDGEPLPVDYVTRPREWPMLVRAREFPALLLARGVNLGADLGAGAVEAGAPLRLAHGSFDAADFSPTTHGGWYCAGIARGLLTARADAATRTEGVASLMFEVLEAAGGEAGRPGISQIVATPTDAPRVRFSLASRGAAAQLAVGWWSDGSVFRELGRTEMPQADDAWSRHQVEVDVPAGVDQIGLFVWFPREAGARVWLDDARVEQIER